MTFDIRLFDKLSPERLDFSELLEQYTDQLLEEFMASPEGAALRKRDPDAGFWCAQFITYGFDYIGASPTQITKSDAEELLQQIFPRKISLFAPEDADHAIPELTAFWQYLGRQYGLKQADAILDVLKKAAPHFRAWMNDPRKWGMAKSLVMAGQSAGFDMTDEEDAEKFFAAYNASIAGKGTPGFPTAPIPLSDSTFGEQDFATQGYADAGFRRIVGTADREKKKKRKAAEASRRKNRKK